MKPCIDGKVKHNLKPVGKAYHKVLERFAVKRKGTQVSQECSRCGHTHSCKEYNGYKKFVIESRAAFVQLVCTSCGETTEVQVDGQGGTHIDHVGTDYHFNAVASDYRVRSEAYLKSKGGSL